jgi:hypothetical protein
MNYKRSLSGLILVLILLLNNACAFLAGGAAGIGAIAFIGGELKSTEEVSLDRAWDATKKAMDDMEFTVKSKEKDALSAQLTARLVSGKQVTINLKKESDRFIEISIRIGVFGNEFLSQKILETIRKNF